METTQIKEYIIAGKFIEARKIAKKIDLTTLGSELLNLAYDTENVAFYFFLLDWLFDEESAELQQITSTLLSSGLAWLAGSYKLSMNHLKRAIQLDPDKVEYKLSMLSFYEIPERLLSLAEAKKFAAQILEVCPDNTRALQILEEGE